MAEIVRTFPVPSRGVGLPDYSTAAPVGQVPVGPIHTSADTGELAARLGSPVTFDRRGNVIWYDDFENGLSKWHTEAHGTGASVALSTEWCRIGARSCKLITGNGLLDHTFIQKHLPYPFLSNIGFEISFTVPLANISIGITIHLFTGTTQTYWSIEYNRATHTLNYHNGVIWVRIADNVNLYEPFDSFNTWKLAMDPINNTYLRAILNSNEYDLSSYPGYSLASILFPHLTVNYTIRPEAASNMTSFVDSAIITQNEPNNES